MIFVLESLIYRTEPENTNIKGNETIKTTRNSADAETARNASRWSQRLLPPKCKTPHFPYTTLVFLSRISESQDTTILVGFGVQVVNTVNYPVMPISTFVALCHQNPPTLQADRETDGRT